MVENAAQITPFAKTITVVNFSFFILVNPYIFAAFLSKLMGDRGVSFLILAAR